MAKHVEEKLEELVGRVAKVRRWLVALAVLKIGASCLGFVSVYIGVYAWLDHRRNFGEIGRAGALVLLLMGFALLLYRLTRSLLVHMSCSEAASYIENRNSFNQQLVTAIEYYENKRDYPYSSVLAEQVVSSVDRDSAAFRFDSTVKKWKGYALSAIILFGLIVVWFFVRDNYVYFSSYFARLMRPLAAVEPLSRTSVESVTRDIAARPDSPVTFAAEIRGDVPEFGKLVVVELERENEGVTAEGQSEQIQVRPVFDEEKTPRFEASKSFPKTGRFKYRFETGTASTQWNRLTVCEPPAIEGITADVAPPKRPPRRKWVRPYSEQIEDNTLEVIRGSDVSLDVKVTDKLKEVRVTGPDGKQITKHLDGAEQFSYSFSADRSGFVRFDFVNEQGLVNDDAAGLEVRVKNDEAPKLKLVWPEGDHLATDVGSVPIVFEVTDDFGLDSVKLYVEMPGQKPEVLDVDVEEGTRSKEFTHIIELENYELEVGDSVLFYAQATDIDTGSAVETRTSRSDVYFIEIRPYRQNWRPRPGGGPSKGAGSPPVELLNILEYTRAILKKTWAIAGKSYPGEQDRARLEFINSDVQYCAEQLALIRDDSEYGFNDAQKAVLDSVIEYYEQAGRYLAGYDAVSAIMPEKNAYRTLRKFILEMDMELSPPESGQGQQAPKPDSVKLQERQEFSQEDKERISEELRKLQHKLKKLAREQKRLNRTFENFLEEQSRDKETAKHTNDSRQEGLDEKRRTEKSHGSDKQQSKDDTARKGESSSGANSSKSRSASESQSAGKGQAASDSSASADSKDFAQSSKDCEGKQSGSGRTGACDEQKVAASKKGSKGQSAGKDKTDSDGGEPVAGKSDAEGRADSQDSGGSGGNGASVRARLRMLQAKQRALQQRVSQLKDELEQLPEIRESGGKGGRADARKHLEEAASKMEDFQEKLRESRYKSDVDKSSTNEAVQLMESARRQLDLAEESLDGELMLNDEQRLAREAEEMAEQLADDADALDESVTPLEREEMLARLEAAKRLLERMPEPQWATLKDKTEKGTSSTGLVFTRNPNLAPAEAARQMAREFWSVAINAKKYRRQLIEDEPSDAEFYGAENEFFENAARFDLEGMNK
jgi:hypothetical protein